MRFFLTQVVLVLFLMPLGILALDIPDLTSSESLQEKKQGNAFLQLIWNTDSVIADVEMAIYLKQLGNELTTYSENPDKHFEFLLLDDSSINAFAGPYGYIGVHSGMLLGSDSEAELAGVLSHEISHVTQNHLSRFSKNSNKQTYLMLAGLLLATLVENSETAQAIATSSVAGVVQKKINFTRDHEWEADRFGTKMLAKSGFDPQGLARFFEKLQDASDAQEFLRSHPLSINRISDSFQRAQKLTNHKRQDSFAYLTVKAKLYYQKYGRIKLVKNSAITTYMQAYQAFDKQDYQQAKRYSDELLLINNSQPSNILAGRIASKLGDVTAAQQYFNKNHGGEEDEASLYYAAKAYLDNQQPQLGVAILKSFLRTNQGNYASYKLLSLLYLKQGNTGRSHIQSAKAFVTQGKLNKAIGHYQRAKTLVNSQDLYDVINAKVDGLQQVIDLYKD